jgi:FMN phosphatase YigB (HAD superfamily)
MFVYKKLAKKIDIIEPKTITVDVFDTLLLRKNRAEQWNFWQFSKKASKVLKAENISCSPLLYFSLRNYYNLVLRQSSLKMGNDNEASLDDVNCEIITELTRRKNKITKHNIADLCKKLMQAEIDFEAIRLKPNYKLIKILTNSKLPIYFVTDMYLTSSQIAELLQNLGIELTVNGISSADYMLGKSSGRSFGKLTQKYPNIKIQDNLHIGDHKHADITIPSRLGSNVFWLNLPLHRIRLLLSKYLYGFVAKLFSMLQMRHNYSTVSTKLPSEAQNIGTIFGPAIIYYCHYLSSFANAGNITPILVSSESTSLAQITSKLGLHRPATLPDFGRKLLLQSYCYAQHKQGVSYYSLLKTVQKVQRRKSNFEALITLGLVEPGSNQFNLLGKNAYGEFLEANDKKFTLKLKNSHQKILVEFKKAAKTKNLSKIIIGDVGWNNTIQILLGEVLKDSGYSGELNGLYLGLTGTNVFSPHINTNSRGIIFNNLKGTSAYLYQPEVWESFLNNDNIGNTTREQILKGVDISIKNYQQSQLSPLDYYDQSHNKLLKTLAAPTKRTIKVFANLKFDYGTGDEAPVPMVDISHQKLFVYRLLARDRARFKQFYHDNGWKWGAANWYHFKLIYRLWRKKTRKPSF